VSEGTLLAVLVVITAVLIGRRYYLAGIILQATGVFALSFAIGVIVIVMLALSLQAGHAHEIEPPNVVEPAPQETPNVEPTTPRHIIQQ
jgi:hypothetical protein